MKVLTIIFCLFLSVKALAQSGDPLYVVDGKVVLSISNIKAVDIMETSILPDSAAVAKYGPKAANGAMVVTTVAGAITIYEQKLSAFNKRYKNYLEKHHGDDTKLAYVINNTILMEKGKKTVGKLYDLEVKDIAKIDYRTDRRFTTDATIVITTTDDSN